MPMSQLVESYRRVGGGFGLDLQGKRCNPGSPLWLHRLWRREHKASPKSLQFTYIQVATSQIVSSSKCNHQNRSNYHFCLLFYSETNL